MAASVVDAFKKVATRALVERQLDPSSVAVRLRGVRESRRIHVPPLVLVSAVVESGPRHQQSKELVGQSGRVDLSVD
ncbi:hypothetical protein Taro_041943 [Colocasia esculenta]|uniref:Uncharacterized protein n=1 Tax=Colocasia esculenta TaxID=4460 RepID=A0A843WRC3_COLES|nr:hypothetical protein [Colocasia esculenta]